MQAAGLIEPDERETTVELFRLLSESTSTALGADETHVRRDEPIDVEALPVPPVEPKDEA